VFAVAAYNYETTLQLAGVIGIEVTLHAHPYIISPSDRRSHALDSLP